MKYLYVLLAVLVTTPSLADVAVGRYLWIPSPASVPAIAQVYDANGNLVRTDKLKRETDGQKAVFEVYATSAIEIDVVDGTKTKYKVVTLSSRRCLQKIENCVTYLLGASDKINERRVFPNRTVKHREAALSSRIALKNGGFTVIAISGELRLLED